MSSAYVNAVLKEAHERLYPCHMDAKELLSKMEKLSDEELEKATPSIIKDHPNPYTFTKLLAEHEVSNSGLPAAIVRPSMSK